MGMALLGLLKLFSGVIWHSCAWSVVKMLRRFCLIPASAHVLVLSHCPFFMASLAEWQSERTSLYTSVV